MKKGIKVEYDAKSVTGVATLTDSQLAGFTNSNSVRLRDDLVYFIPKQKAHGENITVRGRKMTSNKVFAFGCIYDKEANTLTPVSVTSLSINGLRQRHYGLVSAGPVKAEAEQREGLWRMKDSLPQTSVFAKGGLNVHIEGKNAVVDPCYFTVIDRQNCHTIGMTEKDGKYDFNTKEEGGKHYIEFQSTPLNVYQEELGMPEIGNPADLCEDFGKFAA